MRHVVLSALALIAAGAGAQTAAGGPPLLRDLDGGAAYRTHVHEGVEVRLDVLEPTRRGMLLAKCKAMEVERVFPGRPAPRTIAAWDAVTRWALQGGVPGVQDHPVPNLDRRLGPFLVEAAFTPQELAAWDQFRATPAGKRGIEVAAVRQGILKVGPRLQDDNTGNHWHWPLARLRQLADATTLRQPLDAAFDRMLPGGAAAWAGLSAVPGEEPAQARLAEAVAMRYAELADAFVAQLPPADRQAWQDLQRQPVYARWPQVWQAVMDFIWSGTKAEQGQAPRAQTVPELCSRAKLRNCGPVTSVGVAVATERTRHSEFTLKSQDIRAAQVIARKVPEAGCP